MRTITTKDINTRHALGYVLKPTLIVWLLIWCSLGAASRQYPPRRNRDSRDVEAQPDRHLAALQRNGTDIKAVVAAPRALKTNTPVSPADLQRDHGNATSFLIGINDETARASQSSSTTRGPVVPASNGSDPPSDPSVSRSSGSLPAANDTGQGHSTLLNTPIFGSLNPLIFTNTTYNTSSGTKPLGPPAPSSSPAIQDPSPYDYQNAGPPASPTVFFTAVIASLTAEIFNPELQALYLETMDTFLAMPPAPLVSKTTVLGIKQGASGLWVATSVQIITEDTDLMSYLAATISADVTNVYPTSVWGEMSANNVKEAMPSSSDTLAFDWSMGDYSNCSVLCGGGQQFRDVYCMDSLGNNVQEGNCPQPPPAANRSCNDFSCTAIKPTVFNLILGEWGACSSTCGPGTRTRSITCQSEDGFLGPLTNCNLDPAKLAAMIWEPCPDQPACPAVYWDYSEWICTSESFCGSGIASRNASCVSGTPPTPVNISMCSDIPLDNMTQPCELAPCVSYYWKARELADCEPENKDEPCGKHTQIRKFDCVNLGTGDVVAPRYCPADKPNLGDPECPLPPACLELAESLETDGTGSGGGGDNSTTDDASKDTVASGADSPIDGATESFTAAPALGSVGGGEEADEAGRDSSSSNSGKAQAGENTQFLAAGGGGSGSSSNGNSTDGSGGAGMAASKDAGTQNSSSNISNSSNIGPGGNPGTATATPPGVSEATATGGVPLEMINASASISPAPNNAPASGTNGNNGDQGATDSGSVLSSAAEALNSNIGLPMWMLEAPNPSLSAMLHCPAESAISANGTCCNSKVLDRNGSCCEAGKVDACGVCGGHGTVVDALGNCCSGRLDAQGVCCNGQVDDCGVCNGNGACNVRALLLATLPNAPLWLGVTSPAGKRLKGAIQEAVAAAITKVQGKPFDKSYCSITLSAVSKAVDATNSSSHSSLKSGSMASSNNGAGGISKIGGSTGRAAPDTAVNSSEHTLSSNKPVSQFTWPADGDEAKKLGPSGRSRSSSSFRPGSSSQSRSPPGPLGWVSISEAQPQQAHVVGATTNSASGERGGDAYQVPETSDGESFQAATASGQEPRSSSSSSGADAGEVGAAGDVVEGDLVKWPSEGAARKALSATENNLDWGTDADGSCFALNQPGQETAAGSRPGLPPLAGPPVLPTRQLSAAAASPEPIASKDSTPINSTGTSGSSSSHNATTRSPVLISSDSSGTSSAGSEGSLVDSSLSPSPGVAVGSGNTSGTGSSSPVPHTTTTASAPAPILNSTNTSSASSSMNTSNISNGTNANSSNSSGNSIQVDILLRNPGPSVKVVPDTATVLLALQQLLLNPLPLPLSKRDFLMFQEAQSIRRTGTCDDGVCQVNERILPDNHESCAADCRLPFLSCPPFLPGMEPCSAMGTCFRSIGACACFQGYMGADCSMCALGYKRLRSYCVAVRSIVPPGCANLPCKRSNSNLALVLPPEERKVGWQRGVIVGVLGGMMLLVAVAAAVVWEIQQWALRVEMQALAKANEAQATM